MTSSDTKHPNDNKSERRLIPVTKWNEYHDWPPIGGLRHLVFNEERNGFSKVVRRVGRRVLLDEAAFFEWVDEYQEQYLDDPFEKMPRRPGRRPEWLKEHQQ